MGCHARLQEIFPKGTELACLMSPALAGGFFTTSATITTDTFYFFFLQFMHAPYSLGP